MGIRGLQKLISENKGAICTERRLRGELVIDGYAILHELFDSDGNHFDWASGGRYAQQHRATVDYFEALVRAGVKPIVVVDGGGCRVQHEDTVYRRNRNIADIPGLVEKHHNKEKGSHTMPIMAREVFVSSLREKKIEVYMADGKASKTIVSLANYYQCPVLTNNTNYCVHAVTGGVLFFKHFNVDSCVGYVYELTKLVEFCNMHSPSLVKVVLAILGDGGDTSIPYLNHGRIKAVIQNSLEGINTRNRSWVLNIVDFLRIKKIKTYDEFKHNFKALNFGRQGDNLLKNCEKVEQMYQDYSAMPAMSVDEIKTSTTMQCSKPCPLPVAVLDDYRRGTFPVLAMNAITLGECVLEQFVGDQEQPPFTMLGLPVRQVIYGLASTLMNQRTCRVIKEYHRSVDGGLQYEGHDVSLPGPAFKYSELVITNLSSLDEESRKVRAVQAICEVLECPEDVVHKLEDDKSLTIVTLVTRYWAKHLIDNEPMPNPKQLIKALVINFFFNLSDPESHRPSLIDESNFSDTDWYKIYHALLEWQSLYRNVCSLNFMLLQPLQMRSTSFLFDGPLIFFLAMNPAPQIIDTYMHRLDPEQKGLFIKVLDIVLT